MGSNGGRGRRHVELGSRIKRAREIAGLSQYALAQRLDVTAGAVGQWEVGYSGPKRELLDRLAKTLNVTLADLLANVTVETPNDSSGHAVQTASVALQLDAGLLKEARELGLDVPAALNQKLRDLVVEHRRRRWLLENREALADANAFLARHGLWSDGKRQF